MSNRKIAVVLTGDRFARRIRTVFALTGLIRSPLIRPDYRRGASEWQRVHFHYLKGREKLSHNDFHCFEAFENLGNFVGQKSLFINACRSFGQESLVEECVLVHWS